MSRLHFFPALLPLTAILPGALATIGAIASAFHALRGRKGLAGLFAAAALLILTGFGIWLRLHPAAGLPGAIAVETLPAVRTSGSWSQALPRAALSTPAVSGRFGLLLFGTWQKTLEALSLKDGTLAFALQLDEPVYAEPLIAEDRAYVAEGLHESQSASLVAIALPSGQPLWARSFPSHLESPPRVSAGTLWGCAGDAGAYAVRASDGAVQWTGAIGHCDTTPWLEGETLYAVAEIPGTGRSRLVALEARDGKPGAMVDLPGMPWGTPVRDPASGLLLVTTGTGNLASGVTQGEKGWAHAVDTRAGKVVWSVELGGMPLPTGLVTGLPASLALATVKTGELIALDPRDGTIRWKRALGAAVLSPARPLPGGTRIAALAYDGTLFELDARSGEVLARRRIAPESTSAPVFAGEHAIFATRSTIFGLPLRAGALAP